MLLRSQDNIMPNAIAMTAGLILAIFSTQLASFILKSYHAMHSECLFREARCAFDNKDYKQAERLWRQSYLEQRRESSLLAQQSESANNLGVALALQGKYPEAAQKFEEVITIRRSLSAYIPSGVPFYQLAKIHLKWGNVAKAKELLTEAESIYSKTEGRLSLDASRVRALLADLKSNV